jgi:hypothetical protein
LAISPFSSAVKETVLAAGAGAGETGVAIAVDALAGVSVADGAGAVEQPQPAIARNPSAKSLVMNFI